VHRSSAAAFACVACAAVVTCARSARAEERATERPPATWALLLNGGQRAAANYQSHLHHLQDMFAALEARGVARDHIAVFSSDGEAEGADLAVREWTPREDFWLIDRTEIGRRLKPRTEMVSTKWDGVELHPARHDALREWFRAQGRAMAAGDTLFVYVTDHGTREKVAGGSVISLWEDDLAVPELRALLGWLPEGVRVVTVMSQCYSGGFADLMYEPGRESPAGRVCGFFSTHADRLAYGCYPEGRARDRIGHGFRFIGALGGGANAAHAHAAVIGDDGSPDVPLSTSDAYLARVLADEAARRGSTPVDALADELMRAAWRERARWEPELRLLDALGDRYGSFSPRSLAELDAQTKDIPALAQQLRTYADRWKMTLEALQTANLDRFIAKNAAWKEKLDARKLAEIDAAAAATLLAALLPDVARFTRTDKTTSERLASLREKEQAATSAWYRLEVRHAITLRQRALLTRIAGRTLLASAAAETGPLRAARDALAALDACEANPVGKPPASGVAARATTAADDVERYPPLAEELKVVERVLPSWLGINYRPVNDAMRERFKVGPGVVVVEAVYPDSAAAGAGLKPGDLVLGPPEAPFDEPHRIREWTMTSPQHTPLPLKVLRDGRAMQVALALGPYPIAIPKLPGPPAVGSRAPDLGALDGLDARGGTAPVTLAGKPHLMFFWATWCGPCKAALPELLAWSKDTGTRLVAISDEEPEVQRLFFASWKDPFPEVRVADVMRVSFLAHGVSGTPTFILVDGDGTIRHRQVGYRRTKGLGIDGWTWRPDAAAGP
jgi:thiol-disulfide isomerase/thioredoxin